jgi:hypothetical protein
VSGFAFRFDPTSREVFDLTLLTPGGPRAVRPEEEILAVTNEYLADGQDGFDMLRSELIVSSPQDGKDLKDVIRQALRSSGILEPRFEGRICNTLAPSRCLANR